MRELSARQIAVAILGAAAAAVVALAVVAWQAGQRTVEAAVAVRHTMEVLGALGDAETALYRAEAAQRAFLAVRRQVFVDERNEAVDEMFRGISTLGTLTADNATQQQRIEELRRAVQQRVRVYHETQQMIDAAAALSIEDRVNEGARVLGTIKPLLAALDGEERRLLAARQELEAERYAIARTIFGLAGGGFLLLLPLLFWRARKDERARHLAEESARIERRFESLHADALTLYNAETDRRETLDGTLELLARSELFPVSAFYMHEDWGSLRLAASHGTPADTKPVLRLDDGPVGQVARTGRPVYLDAIAARESALGDPGLRVEAGFASLVPAALLFHPVTHQGKQLGVLALGAATPLGERDRRFVERLAAQLAVAMHNLAQIEGQNLLAEQLRERGDEVQRKNDELVRANRMKSEFVANMSHELRTPLNAVIGFSEIMRDGLVGPLSDEQREYIGDIYTSGKHLLSLINDILDLSKVEAGQMSLELSVVDPIELAASGMSVVRDRAQVRSVQLSEMVAPGLGRLCLDLRRSKQIVFNLLSNAVKFTPDGGSVSLHIQRITRERIDAVQPSDDTRMFKPPEAPLEFLEISVTDTGIGIAPAGLRELFQPFVQIDSSLSRKFDGTGLGLMMTQRLTELHGGGLMVHSRPGEGSTFTVWLPWREPSLAQEQAELALPAPPPEMATPAPGPDAPLVLLIEDDPRAASLMRVQLQDAGYRVELARNGEIGLQRAAELQPQALLIDIILPGMDGWDLLSRLKDVEATRRIPVVIVSVTDEPKRGFALGATQVLTKPVAKDDLQAALMAIDLGKAPSDARVLVVDDDPKAVTLVSKLLQSSGFSPVSAYGGQQALDQVRARRPDLIVLDLMMPHISGFDVVDALARQPDTADIPVLVLTAKLLTARDREMLRGRVQRVMEKSEFQPASLLAEIRRALARRTLQKNSR